jgi:mRNA interferase MazF
MTPRAKRAAFDCGADESREQSGRRPALVVSPSAFWQASDFLIVCPITPKVRLFCASVVLPGGGTVAGEVLASHVRSNDTHARPIAYAGFSVAPDLLADVRAKLAALIGV